MYIIDQTDGQRFEKGEPRFFANKVSAATLISVIIGSICVVYFVHHQGHPLKFKMLSVQMFANEKHMIHKIDKNNFLKIYINERLSFKFLDLRCNGQPLPPRDMCQSAIFSFGGVRNLESTTT